MSEEQLEFELFTYNLIEEIRKHEFLYNKDHPKYRKWLVKQKTWEDVAAAVNTDVEMCQQRWRSLRTCFVKELEKDPETNDKPWMYFENMMFLKDHIKKRSRMYMTPEFINSEAPCSLSVQREYMEVHYEDYYSSGGEDEPQLQSIHQVDLFEDTSKLPTDILTTTPQMPPIKSEPIDEDHSQTEEDILSPIVKPTSRNINFLAVLDDYLMKLPNNTQDELKMKILSIVLDEISWNESSCQEYI